MRSRLSLAGRVAAAVAARGHARRRRDSRPCSARWLLAVARRRSPRSCWSCPSPSGSAQRATRPWSNVVRALTDGVASLRDHDFSIIHRPAAGRRACASWSRRTTRSAICCGASGSTCISASCCSIRSSRPRRSRWCSRTPAARIVFSNIAARQLLLGGPQARRPRPRERARAGARAAARSRRRATPTRCSRWS